MCNSNISPLCIQKVKNLNYQPGSALSVMEDTVSKRIKIFLQKIEPGKKS